MTSAGSRFKAFLVGLLMGSIAFAPVHPLLAACASPSDAIAREYPEYQSVPANANEVHDALAGIEAGLTAEETMQPQPIPYRDYSAFLSDLWNLLFQDQFVFGTSALLFDSWIPDGTGVLQGGNENNEQLTASITFTLATPYDELVGLSSENADILNSVEAMFGIAWIEVFTAHSSARLFGWWMEMTSPSGQSVATFIPVMAVRSMEWQNLGIALPALLDDIGSIWDDADGDPRSPLSSFKRKVRSAAKVAAVVIGVAVVVAVVAAAAPLIAGSTVVAAAVSATVSLVGGCITASVVFDEKIKNAIADLRDDIEDDHPNLNTSGLTDAQVVELAEELYR